MVTCHGGAALMRALRLSRSKQQESWISTKFLPFSTMPIVGPGRYVLEPRLPGVSRDLIPLKSRWP